MNQIIGDGLMAIFGAPLPLGEPAFSAEQQAAGRPAVRIGVGIASGEVIAGYTGTQSRVTYTCVGDTVNLAARLEAHTKAAGCEILLDGATHAALEGALRTQALGEVSLKGKAAAVPVFVVVS